MYKIIEERNQGWDFPHDSKRHECDRICSKHDAPKTCHYTFVIEQHTSMGKVYFHESFVLNLYICANPNRNTYIVTLTSFIIKRLATVVLEVIQRL